MSSLSVWQKDKKELATKRKGYWEYCECLVRIVRTESYLEEYETVESFLKNETDNISRPRFYQLEKAVETRNRLSTMVDTPPDKERHLREIAKVPENQQKKVFAETLERCEQEGREPTEKDFRKTAKEIVAETEYEYIEKDENEPLEEGEIDCGPVEETPEDHKRHLAIAKKHAEACSRSLGDADDAKKSPQYDRARKLCYEIQEVIKRW